MSIGRWTQFVQNQKGATAIEFALLIAPFLFLLLGIFEVGMQYFVLTSFDSAVQRAARLVRTGQAQSEALSKSQFRDEVCGRIWDLFDCRNKSYFTVEATSVMYSPAYVVPVKADGSFIDKATYDLGVSNSYMVVRGFMQYRPLFDVFGSLAPKLGNGNQLFVSSALFRNEPF